MSRVDPVECKRLDSRVANEKQRKSRVMHSPSSHIEIMKKAPRRGSLDVSVSPIVSLKKRAPFRRRGSEFFDSINLDRKISGSDNRKSSNVGIVTPFAQILTKLGSVLRYMLQENSDKLNNNEERIGITTIEEEEINKQIIHLEISNERNIANGTLSNEKSNAVNDITWCLDQLKRLETHNSVSEMTIDKFRKVLYEKQMSSDCDVAQQVFEFLKSYMMKTTRLKSSVNRKARIAFLWILYSKLYLVLS